MIVTGAQRDVAAERVAIERSIRGRTLLTEFADTAERLGDADALRWKQDGGWCSLSWREYRACVREVALGLAALGLRRGDVVLVKSRIRPESFIVELGALHAGCVPVVLYDTLAPDQIAEIADDCGAVAAVVEDGADLDTLAALRARLPLLRRAILVEGAVAADRSWVTTWDEVLTAGRDHEERPPEAFDESLRAITTEDLATIVYTSGTTGAPKGVMITHRSVLWNLASVTTAVSPPPCGLQISFLPMAHVAGRLAGLWWPVVTGDTIVCCPDLTQLLPLMVEVRPTTFTAVPRIWEKLHTLLTTGMGGEPVDLARVGLDRCELAVSGSAPIEPGVLEFFRERGLPITEGWGMTELGVATLAAPDRARTGTVGPALPGVEVRIAEDGEILARSGGLCSGYLHDPELTAATIDEEGWLHTGDVGTLDADGFLRIVDRKKELIITSGGKNISPAAIEQRLVRHPLIGQVCAIGDRRRYITALLVLDAEVAAVWARRRGIAAASIAELAGHPAVVSEVSRAVDAANGHLSRVERVKRHRVLAAEWTVASGELTPTMKKRRRVIVERYAREIEEMYAEG
jgi:long-chain acyl-CoA synthetase